MAYDELPKWRLNISECSEKLWWADLYGDNRSFGCGRFLDFYPSIYFPLWYPALVFALAAVAAIRVGRRFTLRATLIVTAIVAALIGMTVVL